MKNLIKTLIVLTAAASMAFASVAMAASINDASNDYYTFRTTNMSGTNGSANNWSRNTSVGDNDLLSFAVYYHVTSGTANDVTFSMENLHGRTFSAGSSETVNGQVSTSNAGSSAGTSQVNFTDDVELKLYNVSWQPNQCTSVTCEQSFSGAKANVLSSGINVGSIIEGWPTQGSMVITFKADPVQTTPTYDDCTLNGVTVDHGDTHRFYSTTSVDAGQTCSAFDLVRTCNDGTLSGSNSYQYNSCTVDDSFFTAPDVETENATSIDEDSATLNGEVDFSSDVDAGDVYFVYGTQKTNLNKTTDDSSKSSDTDFSKGISGLDDDTRYYYQAVLDGNDGKTYRGAIKNFTTDDEDGDNGSNNDEEPDVDTKKADNIDEDSATINAFIDINESDEVDFWFQYGTDKDLDTYSRTSKDDYTSNKSVDERLTDLDEDTKYYFRAVIEDQYTGELFYGNIMNFKTDESDEDNEVEAETKSADDIEDDGADMRGYADINDADEAKVYFRYGTSASNLPNKTSPKYIGDSGQITTEISGLQSCKTYYYQFVVEDEDSNDVDRGVVKSFTTKGNNCGVSNPPTVNSGAITRIATGVSTNSAVLRSFVSGDAAATCYFQYGRTINLGGTTSTQGVNLDNTTACSSTLFGLAPNTTYYYRAVLIDGGQTYNGLTRSFRTLSNPVVSRPPVVTPRTPTTPTPVDTTVKVTVIEEVVATGEDLDITKFVSSRDDSRFSDETTADRDEAVFYKVVIRNNSTDVLTDVTVIDRIPFYLELDGERALDDDSEKELRWRIARLQPGESRDFVTEMRVRDDARYGSDIDSFASAYNDDFSLNSNTVVIEVEEDEDVAATVSSTQGASIFGAGFFPTTLVGWAGLLVIVLAIAYFVSRILFSRNENERVLAELRAMQQNK